MKRLHTVSLAAFLCLVMVPPAVSAVPFLSLAVAQADGRRMSVSGRVYDKQTGEGLPFASILVVEGGYGTVADVSGRYLLHVGMGGAVRLKVSSLGYAAREIVIENDRQTRRLDIAMSPQSVALEGFTVTAKYKDRLGSDVTVDQEALEYIQPTSIKDVFQLLPGGKAGSNNMQSRELISSRQAGSDAVTSFGMGVSIDGIPMQNDGQRIQMTGFTGSGSVDGEGNTSVNTGVDLRSLSTDHVESVTLNRGIASAKDGNISSGSIRLKLKQGQSPLRVRVKFDPLNKLAYAGKGLRLSERLGTLYFGADVVRSMTSIEDNRGAYNRITLQANWNNQAEWWGRKADISVRGGYITSFNNNKSDDLTEAMKEKYNTRYQRITLSAKASVELDAAFVDEVGAAVSGDCSSDLLRYDKHVVNATVTPLQRSTAEGESDGVYLPAVYDTFYKIDNRPLNFFGEITANKHGSIGRALNFTAMLGASLTATKNIGLGAVVDPERPPYPSSDFIRPRPNKDIPAVASQAAYAETTLRCKRGRSEINARLGVRETMMLNLPENYALHGKALWEPRMQFSYTLDFSARERSEHSKARTATVRAGYGIENKLPSADYLYPDKVYHDFIAMNAYFADASKRRLITYTKIEDAANPAIRENRARKAEAGLDIGFDGFALSLTAFLEQTDGGLEYFARYTPVSYTYYYELRHAVDARPEREDFYSRQRSSFMMARVPMNSARVVKRGVEYRLHVPRMSLLKTEAEINGAWYRTVYADGVPVMHYPSIMQDDEPYPFVGLYDGYDKTYAEVFNTNFWLNTHLPKLKLIFTNFVQIVWFQRSRLGTDVDVYPSRYMDTGGNIHCLTAGMIASDSRFGALRRDFLSARYDELRKPVSLRMNLKLTKEFGRSVRLSFFADNILQVSPKYQNNYKQTCRDWHRPFFGAEMTVSLF